MSEEDLIREARGDGANQRNDESLYEAEPAAWQGKNEENVESGEEHARQEGQAEEQLQGDGRAQNFGEIAGGNGQFANHPKNQRGASRIVLAASLREVPSGGDAKFRRESLQEHRHQIADQYDAEKRVAEFRAAAQVGSPVARVHVAHGYQIARPREGQNLAEPVRAGSDGNRAMGFGQGRSEEHTSELQSRLHLVCRLLLEKKKIKQILDISERNFFQRNLVTAGSAYHLRRID